jgi:LmbE family N-acetylglucosaminyl deacetylase
MRSAFHRLLLIVVIFASNISWGYAQAPLQVNAAEILHEMKKLKVLGSVLYIAAHPDDENTRFLAYLSKEKLYRTAYLSLTRGDGGQNLIGDEQGAELGLIRTQELLAARKIDGAEQYFSGAFDFGYSKKPEEALAIWEHEKVLGEMVWVIRKFRPDVLVCRFPKTGEGGHGHHTASAILAEEAFFASADSNSYKEQLSQGVSTWQAKRLMWNTFNFSGINTQKETQFKVDVGAYNSLLGSSYGEISSISRSQHKSQGFGVPAQRGASIEYFETIQGSAPNNDLMDEVNTSWTRIGLPEMEKMVDDLIAHYNPVHPEKSLEKLIEMYQWLQSKKQGYWETQKLKALINIIEWCSGIFMESVSSDQFVAQGDTLRVKHVINNRIGLPLSDIKVQFLDQEDSLSNANKNINHTIEQSIALDSDFPLSQPYWLNQNLSAPANVGSVALPQTGNPDNKPWQSRFQFKLMDVVFEFEKPIVYKSTDPVKGEKYEYVKIVPPFSITPKDRIEVLSKNHKKLTQFTVTAKRKININKIKIVSTTKPTGFVLNESDLLINRNESRTFSCMLDSGINSIVIQEGNRTYSQEQRVIQYDHIPTLYYGRPSEINVKKFDLKIEGKHIGYIKGAGDKVPEMLSQMGYEVDLLNQKDLTKFNLKKYDAIVTGIRAYNTNEWMNDLYEILMDYVKSGGVLLVQYNTSNSIGPLKAKIGPYPFTITRNRITNENATVEFLQSNHALLNYPNNITAKDFEGWIQERTIYHAETNDSHYQQLFSMNDPGEVADKGSLIFSDYGKGRFIYTGMVFFRQLPAGVEGAFKLMANLLAKPKH